jgi:hypothetical protein
MGATTHQSASRTFTATAVAIAAYKLVALQAAGTVAATDDNGTDIVVGSTTDATEASGLVAVSLHNAGGTAELTGNGDAIAVGDAVYSDATGKIGTDTANVLIGYALAASSADGDVIEVLLA